MNIRVEVLGIVGCHCTHRDQGSGAGHCGVLLQTRPSGLRCWTLWGAAADTAIRVEVLDIVGCYCRQNHQGRGAVLCWRLL